MVRLLLMTFALDHTPSKYVQIEIMLTKYGLIEQSTDIFTAFSHVRYTGSHVNLYTLFRMRVLEVRYSCYYMQFNEVRRG